jgi:hypothetical protein
MSIAEGAILFAIALSEENEAAKPHFVRQRGSTL